ncbi:MAG: hypothetical protein KUA43_05580 [Hoeflea sp.]|uniref:hypothetical protein n=1 Tax=Hoeflea sp. TaxID=1940281 RepID=UPI001DDB50C6|nr:hypothetical protein [Hoeflea sp.]MBU4531003.1 hypothetical protein [Alphaproteobacteria bacterium]MBU4542778.1 hypothetical protein [Alphaproteobacteria bacterium]MBU4552590.1 hypothetical protein [Alphaproteobacteria bacterium]MBV1722895.1 hypothetical protein [Hoeflea sp.]MBV1762806.1 hypothetical protein [Hoeflea sp.]
MPEVSWLFILAMTTFAIAIGFMLFSLARTRRDRKSHTRTSIPREDIAKARQRINE